ncbi:ATP-dependent endonuclease [Lysinibacillus sp. 2017]|uniref:ATP-dependent nuclease n=1 Tax=unclassified Lysinibacillus TaxID=2636778 RepID=UPI000D528552|nr:MULTISPECIES: AAA family ATPase [unclassified Lysinibacillus]AWE08815.1 ATP-dependent endonuclease [Lysinibacillus sp. 2017]TGN36137.1 ATP-dependent endonuclease [Lysinibacillus sp. S2017]
MKLMKLLITNFRSIGGNDETPGVVIDMEDTNVINLIGQNNVGKSSILHAYDYFVTTSINALNDDFYNGLDNKIIIEAWIKAEGTDDENHRAMTNSMDKNKIGRFRKVWSEVGKSAEKFTWNVTTKEWDKGGAGGFDTILQNACPTPIWLRGLDSAEAILETVNKLIKEKVISKVTELPIYTQLNSNLEVLRNEIREHEYTIKLQDRLDGLLKDTFPNMNLELVNKEKASIEKKVGDFVDTEVQITNNNTFAVGMENHGHGVRRQFLFNAMRELNDVMVELSKTKAQRKNDGILDTLGVQTEQVENKSSILLIEEPELFLHPQSIRAFTNTLYNLAEGSKFQIMTATHSPILVDLSKNHTTLIRVIMTDKGTKAHQVKSNIFESDEKETLKMLNTFNPYVCEAFFADKVILVEGDTEAIVFREILKGFVENRTLKLAESPLIVNCGSKMNIPAFQKVLEHFEIKYFVVHDLDDEKTVSGKTSAAWTMNTKIDQCIASFNSISEKSASRFIMEKNFEEAHGYSYDSTLGKPLSAFKLAQSWDLNDGAIPAVKAMKEALEILADKETQITHLDSTSEIVEGMKSISEGESTASI